MFELRVLSGLHRGAALPLVGQNWIIGSDERADLILKDACIAIQHCQLSLINQAWCLESIQGSIFDTEGHVLDIVESFPLSSSFSLQGIWITVVDAATPWPPEPEDVQAIHLTQLPEKKHHGLGFLFAFFSTAAIVATGAWAALTPQPIENKAEALQTKELKETRAPTLSTNNDEINQSKPLVTPHSDQISLETIPELQYQLQRMIEERELHHYLTIEKSLKQITLTGELNQAQSQRLERMLNRFHQNYLTPHAIEQNIKVRQPRLPFEIKQITSGPLGSVITKEGKRLFVGDELNGIRLVAIHSDKVVFKGTKNFEVAW